MIKILLVTSSILFIIGLIGIFIWGMPGMSFEVPGNKLTETYLTVGDYSIGKQKFQYNICNKKNGCLNGKIFGYNNIDKNYYLYYNLNSGVIKSIDEKEILKYYYKIYNKEMNSYVNNLSDIPKYGYLSNNELKFYSKNDLKNLPIEQQNIFNELEKNPTVIINGVDYTNYKNR